MGTGGSGVSFGTGQAPLLAISGLPRKGLERGPLCKRVPPKEPLASLAGSPEVKAYLALPQTAVYIVRRDPGRDGEIVWASPSLEDVLGFRPEDVMGRNAWGVFVAPEDIKDAAQYSARMSEGDLTAWAPLLKADGSKRWVRFDALNRAGGIVIAFRPEPNANEHHFHGVTIGRTPLGPGSKP
jgi:PAS domain S-box-containing protein